MTTTPTRDDKFSFGLWTIGYTGADPFGGPTRPDLDVVEAVENLDRLGAYGLTFHDDDLFAFGSTDAERQTQIDRLKGALDATGIVVLVTVAAAVTLLPALLGLRVRDRIEIVRRSL